MIRTFTLAAAAAVAGYWVGTRNAESDSRFSEPEVTAADELDSRFGRPDITADDVSVPDAVRDDEGNIDIDVPQPDPFGDWEEFDEDGRIGE